MFCSKCGKYTWWFYSFEMKSWYITGICSCGQKAFTPTIRYTIFNPFKALYLKYKARKKKEE